MGSLGHVDDQEQKKYFIRPTVTFFQPVSIVIFFFKVEMYAGRLWYSPLSIYLFSEYLSSKFIIGIENAVVWSVEIIRHSP